MADPKCRIHGGSAMVQDEWYPERWLCAACVVLAYNREGASEVGDGDATPRPSPPAALLGLDQYPAPDSGP